MDIRYLQSFVTVVEVGSLAEAARRLDLTPAAIAARVRGLEEELGAVLVKRAGRSVKPTAAGEKILERAPRVDPNFGPNWFEPQAKRLTFACKMTALSANLTVLSAKLHYVTFGVITRNITRLIKTPISH